MEQDPTFKAIVTFLQTSGAATGLIIFLCWFLTCRVWPWFTKEYFPALLAREKAEASERSVFREQIGTLSLAIQTMPAAIQTAFTPHFDRLSLSPAELTGLRAVMDNHEALAKTRHDALTTRLDALATLYLGLHAKPPANGEHAEAGKA